MLPREAPIRIAFAGVEYSADELRRSLAYARQTNCRVYHQGGRWIVFDGRSRQRFEVADRCTCNAGQLGHACKHVAAVLSARMRAGELGRCEVCGLVSEIGTMFRQYTHVGGQGYRLDFFCGSGIGHRAGEVAERQEVAA